MDSVNICWLLVIWHGDLLKRVNAQVRCKNCRYDELKLKIQNNALNTQRQQPVRRWLMNEVCGNATNNGRNGWRYFLVILAAYVLLALPHNNINGRMIRT